VLDGIILDARIMAASIVASRFLATRFGVPRFFAHAFGAPCSDPLARRKIIPQFALIYGELRIDQA
jgi:hypothetical protein